MKQEAKAYLTKWKSPSDIERQFSPNNWGYTLSHPDKAYMADCPTLVDYEQIYGEGVSGSGGVGIDYCCVPATASFAFGVNLTF